MFKKSNDHIAVVTALATKGVGMTRQEQVKASGITDNGAFSTVLEELEQCGFIRLYEPFSVNNKPASDLRQKRNTLFQLVDFYTLFYFRFVKYNKYRDSHFWSSSQNSPMYHAWVGLSFELLCLNHVDKVRIFAEETKTQKSLLLTLITSFGLKENKHSDIVQKQITMDELFA